MEAIGRWWDGVELWVTGLPFALQALVVMIVLVPLAALVAIALDVVVTKGFALVGRGDPHDGRADDEDGPDTAGGPRPHTTESED
ncbi:hypothetical protein [Tomitella fengzijianii]|uniref:Uncharacterized protein n=1 Tax=Tomitella fengzijianii TaxID=2597660 RepID=A0A516X4N8_9ACTN|nr:hypothetical protein [Tomitella fengzijianii]QDQ98026.1 hypothetical protein FO059_12755 [Tomitella fengzijianii]